MFKSPFGNILIKKKNHRLYTEANGPVLLEETVRIVM